MFPSPCQNDGDVCNVQHNAAEPWVTYNFSTAFIKLCCFGNKGIVSETFLERLLSGAHYLSQVEQGCQCTVPLSVYLSHACRTWATSSRTTISKTLSTMTTIVLRNTAGCTTACSILPSPHTPNTSSRSEGGLPYCSSNNSAPNISQY